MRTETPVRGRTLQVRRQLRVPEDLATLPGRVSRQRLRSVGELRSGEKGGGYEAEELYFVGRGVMRASLCLVIAPRAQRMRVGVPGSFTKQEVLRPGLMVAATHRAEKRRWV